MNKLATGTKITIAITLGLLAVTQLLPFWLAVNTSLKSPTDLSSALLPPTGEIAFSNYESAVSDGNILSAVLSSAIVTTIATALVAILGAMTAYPLARRLSRVNTLVAAGILSLMMIPPLSILVPLYTMLSQIGGINTYAGQIIVMVAQSLPLSVFLYTAFLRGVPTSLDEAARIDGANVAQVFFRIILPLLKPVTATVVILTSVHVWNDYAMSNYLLTSPTMQTIAPAVATFFAQQSSNQGVGAAAALIAVVPILIAYLFLQRYFMSGMVAGAEK